MLFNCNDKVKTTIFKVYFVNKKNKTHDITLYCVICTGSKYYVE